MLGIFDLLEVELSTPMSNVVKQLKEIESLKAENALLKAENASLRAENASLVKAQNAPPLSIKAKHPQEDSCMKKHPGDERVVLSIESEESEFSGLNISNSALRLVDEMLREENRETKTKTLNKLKTALEEGRGPGGARGLETEVSELRGLNLNVTESAIWLVDEMLKEESKARKH